MDSGYNLKKIQEIELEILDEIIRICDKYQIKYDLEGGSCIGAVRHSGMIPWDDDIDLGMLRSEYDRFVAVCKKELDASRFLFQDMNTDPNCGLIFGKVRRKDTILSETYSHQLSFHQGVWVDIFAYDNVVDDDSQRMKERKKIKRLQNLYIIRCGYKWPEGASRVEKLGYFLIKPFTYLFSYNYYVTHLNQRMRKHNTESCSYVFNYGGAYPDKGLFSKTLFTNLINHEFNGRQVKIFKDYDLYLTQLFGDYMQLPPKEKRNGGSHIVFQFQDNRNTRSS